MTKYILEYINTRLSNILLHENQTITKIIGSS